MNNVKFESLTGKIVASAYQVHSALGPGLIESVYEECLSDEFARHQMDFKRQLKLPVNYQGRQLNTGLRLDFLVEEKVIVELKAVESLMPVHQAQLLTYLKLTGLRVGLLINFNVPIIRQGIKRLVL